MQDFYVKRRRGDNMANASITIPVDNIREFCTNLFIKIGLAEHEANVMAESLLCADLRGVKSHGIVRIPTYLKRVEAGVLNPRANIEIEKKQQATALINANNGFGQIAAYRGMNLAMDLAEASGIGFVGVRHSNHFGICSYYAMLALERDMIGIVFTNASPAMAPYGTSKPLLGTNPIAFAIPAGHEVPIVLDMSTSVVARGKIRLAMQKNEKIPLGWALDEEGNPTDDPEKALKGSLVPIGGVKGSGLSLVIDILCGVLTNTTLTGEVKNITDLSSVSKTGHILCALNVSSFIDVGLFKSNVDVVIRKIKSLPSVGDGPIFLPGEIEYNLAMKSKRGGIPVEVRVIDELNSIASRYGVSKLY